MVSARASNSLIRKFNKMLFMHVKWPLVRNIELSIEHIRIRAHGFLVLCSIFAMVLALLLRSTFYIIKSFKISSIWYDYCKNSGCSFFWAALRCVCRREKEKLRKRKKWPNNRKNTHSTHINNSALSVAARERKKQINAEQFGLHANAHASPK